jgi:ketosteroid isomerase-like protein
MKIHETQIREAEDRIVEAIRTKDVESLAVELTDDFIHSTPGGADDQDRSAFLKAIRDMPHNILDLRLDDLRVRVLGEVALLTGVQQARVSIEDGSIVEGATAFVDVFVWSGDAWRLRHAVGVELPGGS